MGALMPKTPNMKDCVVCRKYHCSCPVGTPRAKGRQPRRVPYEVELKEEAAKKCRKLSPSERLAKKIADQVWHDRSKTKDDLELWLFAELIAFRKRAINRFKKRYGFAVMDGRGALLSPNKPRSFGKPLGPIW